MRDHGRCRVPGCTSRLTQIHHIRHWVDGGPTDPANLVSLCPRPHRSVHSGHLHIATHHGRFGFHTRHGRELPDHRHHLQQTMALATQRLLV